MTLLWFGGAANLRDSKFADVLAEWMSSSPLPRAHFSQGMEHTALLAVHKSKTQAICTYPEALSAVPHLRGLLLELGAPRCGFRVLCEGMNRRGDSCNSRNGQPFPRPIPTEDAF